MPITEPYDPKHPVRIVTAASLFDGHDAAINVMRRIMQATGAEVIHLGHNRSVAEIVDAAIQEDAQGISISSYQGGHIEFFKYMRQLLDERGARHIRIFGGGGGTIVPREIEESARSRHRPHLHPEDGRAHRPAGHDQPGRAAVRLRRDRDDVTERMGTCRWPDDHTGGVEERVAVGDEACFARGRFINTALGEAGFALLTDLHSTRYRMTGAVVRVNRRSPTNWCGASCGLPG